MSTKTQWSAATLAVVAGVVTYLLASSSPPMPPFLLGGMIGMTLFWGFLIGTATAHIDRDDREIARGAHPTYQTVPPDMDWKL